MSSQSTSGTRRVTKSNRYPLRFQLDMERTRLAVERQAADVAQVRGEEQDHGLLC
jgi:hypothetical protein